MNKGVLAEQAARIAEDLYEAKEAELAEAFAVAFGRGPKPDEWRLIDRFFKLGASFSAMQALEKIRELETYKALHETRN